MGYYEALLALDEGLLLIGDDGAVEETKVEKAKRMKKAAKQDKRIAFEADALRLEVTRWAVDRTMRARDLALLQIRLQRRREAVRRATAGDTAPPPPPPKRGFFGRIFGRSKTSRTKPAGDVRNAISEVLDPAEWAKAAAELDELSNTLSADDDGGGSGGGNSKDDGGASASFGLVSGGLDIEACFAIQTLAVSLLGDCAGKRASSSSSSAPPARVLGLDMAGGVVLSAKKSNASGGGISMACSLGELAVSDGATYTLAHMSRSGSTAGVVGGSDVGATGDTFVPAPPVVWGDVWDGTLGGSADVGWFEGEVAGQGGGGESKSEVARGGGQGGGNMWSCRAAGGQHLLGAVVVENEAAENAGGKRTRVWLRSDRSLELFASGAIGVLTRAAGVFSVTEIDAETKQRSVKIARRVALQRYKAQQSARARRKRQRALQLEAGGPAGGNAVVAKTSDKRDTVAVHVSMAAPTVFLPATSANAGARGALGGAGGQVVVSLGQLRLSTLEEGGEGGEGGAGGRADHGVVDLRGGRTAFSIALHGTQVTLQQHGDRQRISEGRTLASDHTGHCLIHGLGAVAVTVLPPGRDAGAAGIAYPLSVHASVAPMASIGTADNMGPRLVVRPGDAAFLLSAIDSLNDERGHAAALAAREHVVMPAASPQLRLVPSDTVSGLLRQTKDGMEGRGSQSGGAESKDGGEHTESKVSKGSGGTSILFTRQGPDVAENVASSSPRVPPEVLNPIGEVVLSSESGTHGVYETDATAVFDRFETLALHLPPGVDGTIDALGRMHLTKGRARGAADGATVMQARLVATSRSGGSVTHRFAVAIDTSGGQDGGERKDGGGGSFGDVDTPTICFSVEMPRLSLEVQDVPGRDESDGQTSLQARLNNVRVRGALYPAHHFRCATLKDGGFSRGSQATSGDAGLPAALLWRLPSPHQRASIALTAGCHISCETVLHRYKNQGKEEDEEKDAEVSPEFVEERVGLHVETVLEQVCVLGRLGEEAWRVSDGHQDAVFEARARTEMRDAVGSLGSLLQKIESAGSGGGEAKDAKCSEAKSEAWSVFSMEAAAEEEQAVLRSLLDDSNYTAHSTDWTTVLPACRVAVPMEDPAARVAARVGSLTVTLNIGEQQAGGSDGNGVCTLFSIAPPDARTGSDRGLTVCVAQVPKPTTDVVGRRERHVLASLTSPIHCSVGVDQIMALQGVIAASAELARAVAPTPASPASRTPSHSEAVNTNTTVNAAAAVAGDQGSPKLRRGLPEAIALGKGGFATDVTKLFDRFEALTVELPHGVDGTVDSMGRLHLSVAREGHTAASDTLTVAVVATVAGSSPTVHKFDVVIDEDALLDPEGTAAAAQARAFALFSDEPMDVMLRVQLPSIVVEVVRGRDENEEEQKAAEGGRASSSPASSLVRLEVKDLCLSTDLLRPVTFAMQGAGAANAQRSSKRSQVRQCTRRFKRLSAPKPRGVVNTRAAIMARIRASDPSSTPAVSGAVAVSTAPLLADGGASTDRLNGVLHVKLGATLVLGDLPAELRQMARQSERALVLQRGGEGGHFASSFPELVDDAGGSDDGTVKSPGGTAAVGAAGGSAIDARRVLQRVTLLMDEARWDVELCGVPNGKAGTGGNAALLPVLRPVSVMAVLSTIIDPLKGGAGASDTLASVSVDGPVILVVSKQMGAAIGSLNQVAKALQRIPVAMKAGRRPGERRRAGGAQKEATLSTSGRNAVVSRVVTTRMSRVRIQVLEHVKVEAWVAAPPLAFLFAAAGPPPKAAADASGSSSTAGRSEGSSSSDSPTIGTEADILRAFWTAAQLGETGDKRGVGVGGGEGGSSSPQTMYAMKLLASIVAENVVLEAGTKASITTTVRPAAKRKSERRVVSVSSATTARAQMDSLEVAVPIDAAARQWDVTLSASDNDGSIPAAGVGGAGSGAGAGETPVDVVSTLHFRCVPAVRLRSLPAAKPVAGRGSAGRAGGGIEVVCSTPSLAVWMVVQEWGSGDEKDAKSDSEGGGGAEGAAGGPVRRHHRLIEPSGAWLRCRIGKTPPPKGTTSLPGRTKIEVRMEMEPMTVVGSYGALEHILVLPSRIKEMSRVALDASAATTADDKNSPAVSGLNASGQPAPSRPAEVQVDMDIEGIRFALVDDRWTSVGGRAVPPASCSGGGGGGGELVVEARCGVVWMACGVNTRGHRFLAKAAVAGFAVDVPLKDTSVAVASRSKTASTGPSGQQAIIQPSPAAPPRTPLLDPWNFVVQVTQRYDPADPAISIKSSVVAGVTVCAPVVHHLVQTLGNLPVFRRQSAAEAAGKALYRRLSAMSASLDNSSGQPAAEAARPVVAAAALDAGCTGKVLRVRRRENQGAIGDGALAGAATEKVMRNKVLPDCTILSRVGKIVAVRGVALASGGDGGTLVVCGDALVSTSPTTAVWACPGRVCKGGEGGNARPRYEPAGPWAMVVPATGSGLHGAASEGGLRMVGSEADGVVELRMMASHSVSHCAVSHRTETKGGVGGAGGDDGGSDGGSDGEGGGDAAESAEQRRIVERRLKKAPTSIVVHNGLSVVTLFVVSEGHPAGRSTEGGAISESSEWSAWVGVTSQKRGPRMGGAAAQSRRRRKQKKAGRSLSESGETKGEREWEKEDNGEDSGVSGDGGGDSEGVSDEGRSSSDSSDNDVAMDLERTSSKQSKAEGDEGDDRVYGEEGVDLAADIKAGVNSFVQGVKGDFTGLAGGIKSGLGTVLSGALATGARGLGGAFNLIGGTAGALLRRRVRHGVVALMPRLVLTNMLPMDLEIAFVSSTPGQPMQWVPLPSGCTQHLAVSHIHTESTLVRVAAAAGCVPVRPTVLNLRRPASLRGPAGPGTSDSAGAMTAKLLTPAPPGEFCTRPDGSDHGHGGTGFRGSCCVNLRVQAMDGSDAVEGDASSHHHHHHHAEAALKAEGGESKGSGEDAEDSLPPPGSVMEMKRADGGETAAMGGSGGGAATDERPLQVTFYTPYWFVNRSGVPLQYAAASAGSDEGKEDAAVGEDGGGGEGQGRAMGSMVTAVADDTLSVAHPSDAQASVDLQGHLLYLYPMPFCHPAAVPTWTQDSSGTNGGKAPSPAYGCVRVVEPFPPPAAAAEGGSPSPARPSSHWSLPIPLDSIGVDGTVDCRDLAETSGHRYRLGVTVHSAPGHFANFTKVVVISPSLVIVNTLSHGVRVRQKGDGTDGVVLAGLPSHIDYGALQRPFFGTAKASDGAAGKGGGQGAAGADSVEGDLRRSKLRDIDAMVPVARPFHLQKAADSSAGESKGGGAVTSAWTDGGSGAGGGGISAVHESCVQVRLDVPNGEYSCALETGELRSAFETQLVAMDDTGGGGGETKHRSVGGSSIGKRVAVSIHVRQVEATTFVVLRPAVEASPSVRVVNKTRVPLLLFQADERQRIDPDKEIEEAQIALTYRMAGRAPPTSAVGMTASKASAGGGNWFDVAKPGKSAKGGSGTGTVMYWKPVKATTATTLNAYAAPPIGRSVGESTFVDGSGAGTVSSSHNAGGSTGDGDAPPPVPQLHFERSMVGTASAMSRGRSTLLLPGASTPFYSDADTGTRMVGVSVAVVDGDSESRSHVTRGEGVDRGWASAVQSMADLQRDVRGFELLSPIQRAGSTRAFATDATAQHDADVTAVQIGSQRHGKRDGGKAATKGKKGGQATETPIMVYARIEVDGPTWQLTLSEEPAGGRPGGGKAMSLGSVQAGGDVDDAELAETEARRRAAAEAAATEAAESGARKVLDWVRQDPGGSISGRTVELSLAGVSIAVLGGTTAEEEARGNMAGLREIVHVRLRDVLVRWSQTSASVALALAGARAVRAMQRASDEAGRDGRKRGGGGGGSGGGGGGAHATWQTANLTTQLDLRQSLRIAVQALQIDDMTSDGTLVNGTAMVPVILAPSLRDPSKQGAQAAQSGAGHDQGDAVTSVMQDALPHVQGTGIRALDEKILEVVRKVLRRVDMSTLDLEYAAYSSLKRRRGGAGAVADGVGGALGGLRRRVEIALHKEPARSGVKFPAMVQEGARRRESKEEPPEGKGGDGGVGNGDLQWGGMCGEWLAPYEGFMLQEANRTMNEDFISINVVIDDQQSGAKAGRAGFVCLRRVVLLVHPVDIEVEERLVRRLMNVGAEFGSSKAVKERDATEIDVSMANGGYDPSDVPSYAASQRPADADLDQVCGLRLEQDAAGKTARALYDAGEQGGGGAHVVVDIIGCGGGGGGGGAHTRAGGSGGPARGPGCQEWRGWSAAQAGVVGGGGSGWRGLDGLRPLSMMVLQACENDMSKLVFVERFLVHTLSLRLTFHKGVDAKVGGGDASAGSGGSSGRGAIGSRIGGALQSLGNKAASVNKVTVIFSQLAFDNALGTRSEILQRILASVKRQALSQLYKVVLKVDLLSTPVNAVSGIGSSVKELLVAPGQAIRTARQGDVAQAGANVASAGAGVAKSAARGGLNCLRFIVDTAASGVERASKVTTVTRYVLRPGVLLLKYGSKGLDVPLKLLGKQFTVGRVTSRVRPPRVMPQASTGPIGLYGLGTSTLYSRATARCKDPKQSSMRLRRLKAEQRLGLKAKQTFVDGITLPAPCAAAAAAAAAGGAVAPLTRDTALLSAAVELLALLKAPVGYYPPPHLLKVRRC